MRRSVKITQLKGNEMHSITTNQWIEAVYKISSDKQFLDPVLITYSSERMMITALEEFNQTENNKFISGLLDAYNEAGTLSEKQWYYLVRMYLKLDSVAQELLIASRQHIAK